MKKKTKRLKKPEVVTIYRDLWSRGKLAREGVSINQPTKLVGIKGLCCLGFVCHASGVPMDYMLNVAYPGNLSREVLKKTIPGITKYGMPTSLSNDAAKFNDTALRGEYVLDGTIKTEKDREDRLRKLFKKHGIRLRFVDKSTATFRAKYFKAIRQPEHYPQPRG